MSIAEVLLQHQVEKFYYRETRLLEEGRYEEWLALFGDAVHYWMPATGTRETRADGIGKPGELSLFNDDKKFLEARVARIRTGLAHAENPPSRTRHFISNVEILAQSEAEISVQCNFLVFQSRLERSESMYFGSRNDHIDISAQEQWRITRRKIVLDQTIVPRSISVFF
jgi:3-phenylpropionate/cinnamic acid dioxygenase small subunit